MTRSKQQLIKELETLRRRVVELDRSEADHQRSRETARVAHEELASMQRDYKERVKELTCLHRIAQLTSREELDVEEVLQAIVNLIPSSWQCRERTCARIVLNGEEFTTDSFRLTEWKQCSSIKVNAETMGVVEVYYLGEKSETNERAFLNEEAVLLESIAREIENVARRKESEKRLKASYEQLRSLSEHLQSVREEERTDIARKIHDDLGQAVTALKIDLSWLAKRLPEEQELLLEKTKSMSRLVDMTMQTVKTLSAELRPGALDDLGVSAAIEWQAEEFQKLTGIKCEFRSNPQDIPLDRGRSTAIFRIFQEALTNVARHANATKVKASLEEKPGELVLEVRDNGKGILKEQIYAPQSFGLIGIRERVHSYGGDLKISGTTNKGTRLTVIIPLQEKPNVENTSR